MYNDDEYYHACMSITNNKKMQRNIRLFSSPNKTKSDYEKLLQTCSNKANDEIFSVVKLSRESDRIELVLIDEK